jgi:hypothetical protein
VSLGAGGRAGSPIGVASSMIERAAIIPPVTPAAFPIKLRREIRFCPI